MTMVYGGKLNREGRTLLKRDKMTMRPEHERTYTIWISTGGVDNVGIDWPADSYEDAIVSWVAWLQGDEDELTPGYKSLESVFEGLTQVFTFRKDAVFGFRCTEKKRQTR